MQLLRRDRLAPRNKSRRGDTSTRAFRRFPRCSVFNTPLRQAWRRILRQIPGGVVWALGYRPMYSVRARSSSQGYSTNRYARALSAQCEEPKLRVYVTNDTSDVYEDQFMGVACDGSGRVQPTLILLGIRLGIDQVTPVYWKGLKAALQYPQSVGIAGFVVPPALKLTDTNIQQRTSIGIPLFRWSTRLMLFLPRPSSYPPSIAESPNRRTIHYRRA